MGQSERVLRITKLRDQGKEPDLKNTTPAERIAMMWPLALDAWAMMGEKVESGMRRDVLRVVRRRSQQHD
jgi:hypothetical protein